MQNQLCKLSLDTKQIQFHLIHKRSKVVICADQDPFLFSALDRKEKRFLDSKEKRGAETRAAFAMSYHFSRGQLTSPLSGRKDDTFVTYPSAHGAALVKFISLGTGSRK